MDPTNILDLLNKPGDSVQGTIVSTQPSPEKPSEYGVVTFDNGLSVDLDYADNLRREMDGVLDSFYAEDPDEVWRLRRARQLASAGQSDALAGPTGTAAKLAT